LPENWTFPLEFASKFFLIKSPVKLKACSLTNVDGDAVLDPASLQNGLIYVAVPFDEDFSRLDYNKIFKSLLPMRE